MLKNSPTLCSNSLNSRVKRWYKSKRSAALPTWSNIFPAVIILSTGSLELYNHCQCIAFLFPHLWCNISRLNIKIFEFANFRNWVRLIAYSYSLVLRFRSMPEADPAPHFKNKINLQCCISMFSPISSSFLPPYNHAVIFISFLNLSKVFGYKIILHISF